MQVQPIQVWIWRPVGSRDHAALLAESKVYEGQWLWATSSTTLTAMTKSSATRSIVWLFLNPENPDVRKHQIELTGYDWTNMTGGKFMKQVLAPEMRKWFDFEPSLSSLRLWIVSLPTPLFVLRSEIPLLSHGTPLVDSSDPCMGRKQHQWL